ncbi:MAG: hypothetical protein RI907_1077 [Pseudomonadota bacterium]|jgi:chemotaxis protein methyltransferase CheR
MALTESTYREISALMYSAIGLSFGDTKRALVESRLAPRLLRLGMDRYEDYLNLIQLPGQADEMQTAIDLLTTNETYFFREPIHFTQLEEAYSLGPTRSLSAWSAASSYGDEPYSIAMLLSDLARRGRIREDWSVLGTDISSRVLQVACEGVYPEDRVREVSQDRRQRYLLRGDGDADGLVMVRDSIRKRVQFGQLNLCGDIDVPGPFDVIFLRNVLIYFDLETKTAVVDEVLSHLKPGGLFFIGMAEGRVETRWPLKSLGSGGFIKEA